MLDTKARQDIDYFVGTEIEHTVMLGKKTLFVVGIKDVSEVKALADKHSVQHIYLGTSQSFTPSTSVQWVAWDQMITGLLWHEFWVTVDFDVQYAPHIAQLTQWNEHNRFIPMISVKLPNIARFNYNATVKLDDTSWGVSNPGVWCHPLHELQNRAVFTKWDDYTGDTPA